MAITKDQVDAKLKELKLPNTPANRKIARTALAPVAPDNSWEPGFKQKYPQYTWMFTDIDRIKNADLFELFGRAQTQNMEIQEFDRQFQGTSWFQGLSESKKGRELSASIGSLEWGSGQLAKFLTKATQYGYEGDNLKQQAYAELFNQVDKKYLNPGAIDQIKQSTAYLNLKNIGSQFLEPVNDDDIRLALTGGKTSEDLLRVAREKAKARYPHLKETLDAGVTLEELSGNFKKIAAQTLELDPASISMSDPKYNKALNFIENGKARMLSFGEWENELRTNTNYGYSFTKKANQDATEIGLAIARAFGKVQ